MSPWNVCRYLSTIFQSCSSAIKHKSTTVFNFPTSVIFSAEKLTGVWLFYQCVSLVCLLPITDQGQRRFVLIYTHHGLLSVGLYVRHALSACVCSALTPLTKVMTSCQYWRARRRVSKRWRPQWMCVTDEYIRSMIN